MTLRAHGAAPGAARTVRVLVVDDSAFMRTTLSAMLAGDRRITVAGTARNGEDAINKVRELGPDVVTLDIEMPGMSGLAVLRHLMTTTPLPVIMVSALTEDGARETLEALELGAVDYVFKFPAGRAAWSIDLREELVAKVVAAAESRRTLGRVAPATRAVSEPKPRTEALVPGGLGIIPRTAALARGDTVIAIGCSTGGPRALMEILPALPEDLAAGVVVAQHMPKYFTKPFAERMNRLCRLPVQEASDGDRVQPGAVLIAPGGVQLRFARRSARDVRVAVSSDSEGRLYAPSVDVMMQSAASVYGERSIGVILTGMGHDGLEGMRAIRMAKGRTIAQDEHSCVVYGMPKAVVEAGFADTIVPLSHVANAILHMVEGPDAAQGCRPLLVE